MSGRIYSCLAASLMWGLAACSNPGDAPSVSIAGIFDGTHGAWVDLTHSFSTSSIYWPTADAFVLDTVAFGTTDGGYFYSAFNFRAAEHGGTHLDAPIHFAAGRLPADGVPLDQLIGAAAVVDVRSQVRVDTDAPDADYQATVEDFVAWEAEHGRLAPGMIVLLLTGWGERYGDRIDYLGTDAVGPAAVPELHFPALAPEAARWLVEERQIGAFGLDTPSLDYGQSSTFETHQIMYTANIPGFENVANMDQLPPTGSFVVALPMKIKGGSGAPLRIVAFVPTD